MSHIIEYRLLLAEGHTADIAFRSDDPSLEDVAVLLAQGREMESSDELLRLPLKDSRNVLIIPRSKIVGIVKLKDRNGERPQVFTSSNRDFKCVIVKNYLSESAVNRILAYTLKNESRFTESATTSGDKTKRTSRVLYQFPEIADILIRRVQAITPDACRHLQIVPFEIGQVECQLTASNRHCYFKVHRDAGHQTTLGRMLTYVYYFFAEPKNYSGGELRLYPRSMVDHKIKHDIKTVDIVPEQNMLVLFPSDTYHEVRPVFCDTEEFKDSRFTLNGWVRRAGYDSKSRRLAKAADPGSTIVKP